MEETLFLRLRKLGDIIFTIPAVAIFKARWPRRRICYGVEEPYREIAELIPGVDRVLPLPVRMGVADILNFRRQMREFNIRTVIDFHSGPKSALLTRLSGASVRIGYCTPNRNWAYNRLLPRRLHEHPSHAVYNQAKLLELLGIPVDEIPPYPAILPPAATPAVFGSLAALRPKVAVHVGAGNRFRDWGEENFRFLLQRLVERGLRVFLIGQGPEEERRAKRLGSSVQVHDFTGKLSIRDTLWLIGQAEVFLGADSGPLHLASLTATPLVGLYGPNIPEFSGPWRKKNVTILQLNMPCRPCSQRQCRYDRISCMQDITVDQVDEALMGYIR